MLEPIISIIISNYKRLHLLRRTLYALSINQPNIPWELVLVNEENDESWANFNELEKYSFDWTFICHDTKTFEQKTGIKKYYNNPSLSYNIGLNHAKGKFICVQGDEVIVIGPTYDNIYECAKNIEEDFILYTTTLNCPQEILDKIGDYGEKLNWEQIQQCAQYPLQTPSMKTLVNNYLSMTKRETLIKINGWPEKRLRGIATEDSSVSNWIIGLPNSKHKVLDCTLTLHQAHESKQFEQDKTFWDKGVAINRKDYYETLNDGRNNQSWPIGTHALKQIRTNH